MKHSNKKTFSEAYDQCAEILNEADNPDFNLELGKFKLTALNTLQRYTGRQIEVAKFNLKGFDHVYKLNN